MIYGVRLCCVAVMFVLSVGAALGQEATVPSAPWLGDETYTIHMQGTLTDAISELRKLTKRYITLPTQQAEGGQRTQVGEDIPVSLEFDEATLDKILLSVCQQAHMVYDVYTGRGMSTGIRLREGDVNVDQRPATKVEGYLIRVLGTSVSSRWSYQFRWGVPLPQEATITDQFQLYLDVIPESPEGYTALAGLDGAFKAELETGGSLEAQSQGRQVGEYWLISPPYDTAQARRGTTRPFAVSLPIPPEGAKTAVKLEGGLRLFPTIRTDEIKVPPNSKGQKLEGEWVAATVDMWQQNGDVITVGLTTEFPVGEPMGQWGPRHTVAIVDKEGKEHYSFRGSTRRQGSTFKLGYRFSGIKDVDHLRVSIVQRTAPDKLVPFVIENVPIP